MFKNFSHSLIIALIIYSSSSYAKPSNQCSIPPENCNNCHLTLTCIAVDKHGKEMQYNAENIDGSEITEIPTTTCNQEGFWSCPDSPYFFSNSIFTRSNFTQDHTCGLDFTSLKSERQIVSPLYVFVKDVKPFEQLAISACKKSAPSNAIDPPLEFGVKSEHDSEDFNWHSVKSTPHLANPDFPINQLIAFGDSITFNGNNNIAQIGGMFLNMVSNGPVWVDHIARKSVKIKKRIELIDIAVPGAALTMGLGDTDFRIMDQVNYALQMTDPDNQPYRYEERFASTVFTLMGGMIDTRDFIGDIWFQNGRDDYSYYKDRLRQCIDDENVYDMNPSELGDICATKILLDKDHSISAAAKTLINHGARYFVISELPNFLLLPRYNGYGFQKQLSFLTSSPPLPKKAKQFLEAYIKTFNTKLNVLINDLEKKYDVRIVKLDLYTLYNKLADINDPITKKAGIKNTKYIGMYALMYPVPSEDPKESPRTYKLEESLFWDDAHPTETASCVIGEYTLELMHQKFGKNKGHIYKPNYKACHHSYYQLKPDESKTQVLQNLKHILQIYK